MRRVASAAMEAFRVQLEHNVPNSSPWHSSAQLHYAITYWIEHRHKGENLDAASDG